MLIAIWPHEVTPPIDHEVVQKIARQVKPDAVAVKVKRASRLRPFGNCYWNVASVVQESRGTVALGWMICWWPQLYAVAIHHAVWRSPDGRLVDVTKPQPTDEASGFTVFVPDETRQVTLDITPCINNEFFPISPLPAISDLISAHNAKQPVRRELARLQRELGIGRDYYLAKAAGKENPVGEKIQVGPVALKSFEILASRLQALDIAYGKAVESVFVASARI